MEDFHEPFGGPNGIGNGAAGDQGAQEGQLGQEGDAAAAGDDVARQGAGGGLPVRDLDADIEDADARDDASTDDSDDRSISDGSMEADPSSMRLEEQRPAATAAAEAAMRRATAARLAGHATEDLSAEMSVGTAPSLDESMDMA